MASGIGEEAPRVGRTEIRSEGLTDFLRTILLHLHMRWGRGRGSRCRRRLDLGKITVEVIGVLLRRGVSVAGASRLIRDHLDAVHTAVKR
jgi:hypothetical protein